MNKLTHSSVFSEIRTGDAKMFSIFNYIESIAQSNKPILIAGETGVGKELIANSIHVLSNCAGKKVVVNVAGLDDHMFADTLFGHVRGSFTGADKERKGVIVEASFGTLILDEIGDLTLASQLKLLRLIQNNEYMPLGSDTIRKSDARIITITNAELWEKQRNGAFRKDLNFRLRTHHIHIPPLRERKGDIPILLDYFCGKAANSLKKKKPRISNEVPELLKSYSFPGNIRELESIVFDAVSRIQDDIIVPDLFKDYLSHGRQELVDIKELQCFDDSPFTSCVDLPTLKQAADMLVAEAMKRAKGNQSVAAQMIGISQPALSKRMKSQLKTTKF